MQLTTRLLAISFAVGALVLPQQAQAGNNALQQMMMLNAVNAEEQKISSQISAYVSSGQLSPQQAAAYNSELSQISSQAMMGGGNATVAVTQLNSLATQISGSLLPANNPYVYGAATNPYVYGAATNPYVYGAATNPAYAAGYRPGFYNNWRSHLSHEQQVLHNEEVQANRNAQIQQNEANKEANFLRDKRLEQERDIRSEQNRIDKERHDAHANQVHAEESTAAKEEAWKHSHPSH